MNSIRYLGHASFEVNLGGTVILFDPFFGDSIEGMPRILNAAVRAEDVKKADIILITHEHASHCDAKAVPAIAERTFAHVVAPKPALSLLQMNERLKVDIRLRDRFELGGVEIEAVKAVHPQSAYPLGYLVRKGGFAVYHAGDTYSYPEMNKIRCDVALLPIGGASTMDALGANAACKDIRPKIAIPMHYNTFERIMQDEKEFLDDLGSIKGIALRVGETARIS